MHKRKEIRERVISLLLNATSAGDKVYETPVRRTQEANLPCLSVYCTTENVEDRDEAPRYYRRVLTLVVECKAKATAGLDDVLDALSYQVEVVLEETDRLGLDFVQDFRPKNSVLTLVGDRLENLAGCMQVEFEVVYDTPAGPSPEELDNLNTITADWKLNSSEVTNAADTLDFEGTHDE